MAGAHRDISQAPGRFLQTLFCLFLRMPCGEQAPQPLLTVALMKRNRSGSSLRPCRSPTPLELQLQWYRSQWRGLSSDPEPAGRFDAHKSSQPAREAAAPQLPAGPGPCSPGCRQRGLAGTPSTPEAVCVMRGQ